MREEWRIAAISVVIIVLCGLKFTYGIENIIDITLYDESYYLQSGANLLKDGLPAADQAPLYAIWYFILSRFITNNLDLYYLNYKILTILPIILMYLVLYKFKKPWLISILAALYFMISRANLPVFIKVSHFALCVILFFLMISRFFRTRLMSLAILTVGILLASYVRPEFFLSFVILLVMPIITFFKDTNRISSKYEVGSYVILLSMVFLLIWTLGFPLAWQGKRLWVAFGQHFAVNYGKWHGVADSPWNTWLTTWQGTFGNTESILAAFYSNPSMLIKHVLYNLKELFIVFGELSLIHYNILLPPATKMFNILEGVLMLATCLVLIISSRKTIYESIKNGTKIELLMSKCLVIIIFPVVLSSMVIYPRSHYLMIVFSILLVGLVINCTRNDIIMSAGKMVLAGVILLGLTPYIGSNWYFADSSGAKQMNTINTIKFIKNKNITKSVNILNAEGVYNLYLGENFAVIDTGDKNGDFKQFLDNKEINLIVLSENLKKESKLRNDIVWQDFLVNYSKYQFEKYDVPNSTNKVYIKTNLQS